MNSASLNREIRETQLWHLQFNPTADKCPRDSPLIWGQKGKISGQNHNIGQPVSAHALTECYYQAAKAFWIIMGVNISEVQAKCSPS